MYLSRDLRKIEKRLQQALQPIKPPALFVADLRERLDQEMAKKAKTRKVRNGLLVAGSVVGLAALLITVIRKLTTWEKPSVSIPRTFLRFRKREQAAPVS